MVHTFSPALGRWRQIALEFKPSRAYVARPCQGWGWSKHTHDSVLHDPQTNVKPYLKPVETKQQAVLSTRPLGDVSLV